jgi:hypothetical protein
MTVVAFVILSEAKDLLFTVLKVTIGLPGGPRADVK